MKLKKLLLSLFVLSVFSFSTLNVNAASGGITYKWSVYRSQINQSVGSINSSNVAATMSVNLYTKATYGATTKSKNTTGHNQGDGFVYQQHVFPSNYTVHYVEGNFNYPGGPHKTIEQY